ncbi:hypothetical protein [Actinoplanes utahensis]|uniref:hypothetical protein n=1 Tax=Actinoplanes utahensis TaxID=1869 RepID=UPI00126A2BCA|nr:hypothetical protein [Actinoplanes utahensis]GIF33262.1 hypothetical protein Aut01nite_62480 [Actinoplanes utahensis]
MISFEEIVTRHSRTFLFGTCAASVVVGVLAQIFHDGVGVALVVAAMLVALFFVVFGLLAGTDRYGSPAVLVRADGPSFETPVVPLNVLSAAGLMVLWLAFLLPERVGEVLRGEETWLASLPVTLVWLPILGALWWRAAKKPGRLLPAGVEIRGARGPVLLRWEEIAPEDVSVVDRFAIRGVGVRSRAFFMVSTKPGRLASIIRQYAADPTHRPAIGSAAELARLTGTGS